MKVDVILGLQWGDEGKGKIVDALAPEYDIIARFQGGPNAGHTIEFEGKKFVLHTIPSGIFRENQINIIGNGVVLDPAIWLRELELLQSAGFDPSNNLLISSRAHLILPSHRLLDAVSEMQKGSSSIGSTLKGIGPTYTDKYCRAGIRVGSILQPSFDAQYKRLKEDHLTRMAHSGIDISSIMLDKMSFDDYEQLWFKGLETLRKFKIIESELYLNDALNAGKRVLAEGAQGSLLDIDFGSYPFVTSSNTTTGGVCTGLGIAPSRVGKVIGIFKAYCTRVGNGPFPTELFDEQGEMIRKAGNEFGSTTGRPRRCGWIDIPALRYAIMLNGVTDLVMTKSDVMSGFNPIYICSKYQLDNVLIDYPNFNRLEDSKPFLTQLNGWDENLSALSGKNALPVGFLSYISTLEEQLGMSIGIISVGPGREQLITK